MYIDTSAAIKLYVDEPDSLECEKIVDRAPLASSRLLYCEFQSALMAKAARGAISEQHHAQIWRQFVSDIEKQKITLFSLDDVLVENAADILFELRARVPVRTLDALHLATCLSLDAGPLFTKDLRMLEAAACLGIPLAG